MVKRKIYSPKRANEYYLEGQDAARHNLKCKNGKYRICPYLSIEFKEDWQLGYNEVMKFESK